MATKIITLEGIGPVRFSKSSRSRSIKLTVSSGNVRVTMPHWTPFIVAENFVLKHTDWLKRELDKQPTSIFVDGQKIGKLHHLQLQKVLESESVSSRVTPLKIIVKYYPKENITGVEVQSRVKKAVLRALKKEAEQLLPPRLRDFATKHGFMYSGFAVKQLRRRWGSCDSHQNLVFNLFLMETPWDCIDYVLLHELTHTEHMNHGPEFWARLTAVSPRARDLRRQLNTFRPMIGG